MYISNVNTRKYRLVFFGRGGLSHEKTLKVLK